MKLLHVISILLLLSGTSLAEDLIFFADDHYKSLGRPELTASVVNPALAAGECTLRINLANIGELNELIPINESGSNEDILLEIKEETNSSDAMFINAVLVGSGPIEVTSEPQQIKQSIKILPGGGAAMLQFNITAQKNASGWYALPLIIDYERQVDVSVKSGEVFPLYEAERQNFTCPVFLAGSNQTLRIFGIKSELYAGGSESLSMVISNNGGTKLHNCSAKLLAAPPFYIESQAIVLGDLAPGSLDVITFKVHVDGDACQRDFQLGCEIDCQEKSIIVPLQITLSRAWVLGDYAWPIFGGLTIAGLAAILIWKRGDLLFPRKRRKR